MAGHSKWANIKHQKGRADAKKGKIFSRLTKEIISSVRLGGSDPKSNPRLRVALQKARAANMPNDNIDRNIKKALSTDQADFLPVMYEFYGHGGVGIIIEALTDNKNRTASDMRIATNKRGGTIASPGAVSFNFDQKGIIQILKDKIDEDTLFMVVTEAGAEDLEVEDDLYIVVTAPSDVFKVKDAIDALNISCEDAELKMIPKVYVDVDEEAFKANMALIEWLEDLDDVDAVYHNMQQL